MRLNPKKSESIPGFCFTYGAGSENHNQPYNSTPVATVTTASA